MGRADLMQRLRKQGEDLVAERIEQRIAAGKPVTAADEAWLARVRGRRVEDAEHADKGEGDDEST